jgi:hypothetical protein
VLHVRTIFGKRRGDNLLISCPDCD